MSASKIQRVPCPRCKKDCPASNGKCLICMYAFEDAELVLMPCVSCETGLVPAEANYCPKCNSPQTEENLSEIMKVKFLKYGLDEDKAKQTAATYIGAKFLTVTMRAGHVYKLLVVIANARTLGNKRCFVRA
eukprot:PhM_4_TR13974/c0_g1_i1/m.36101